MNQKSFMCVYMIVVAAKCSSVIAESAELVELKNSTSPVVVATTLTPSITRPPPLQGVRLPCSCQQGQCGCCTGVILERFRQKACVNITYEPDEFAFTAALSLNGRILYKNSISGKNPPPICIRLPRFRFIELCVEFSNIYFANRNVHVCIDMEASWESLTLLDFSFDCIRMGINGVAVVGPEEGGGLPISPTDEEEQTDEDYDDDARNVQSFVNNSPEGKDRNETCTGNCTALTITDSKNLDALVLERNKNRFKIKNYVGKDNKHGVRVERLENGDFVITWRGRVGLENEN